MDKKEYIAKQKQLDQEYLEKGLTDDIIDRQIELNKLRNEYNIDIGDDYRQ